MKRPQYDKTSLISSFFLLEIHMNFTRKWNIQVQGNNLTKQYNSPEYFLILWFKIFYSNFVLNNFIIVSCHRLWFQKKKNQKHQFLQLWMDPLFQIKTERFIFIINLYLIVGFSTTKERHLLSEILPIRRRCWSSDI